MADIPGGGSYGIKFRVHIGDVWSMEGVVRHKYMHAVAAPYPAGVHHSICLECKVTAALRNGLPPGQNYCVL